MGKYMRKAKVTRDVAVTELSQSSLGVRTRAKTLALQRIEAANSLPKDSSCYLQLRNRRLQKTIDVVKHQKTAPKQSFGQNPEVNLSDVDAKPRTSSRLRPVESGSVGSECGCGSKNEKGCFVEKERNDDAEGLSTLNVEASFGENNVDFEVRERSTRESTPCSLIRGSDNTENLGSSTRTTSLAASNRQTRNIMQRNITILGEMEEFFDFTEQQQQKLFTEKYNFDVANDLPLPGRYEWVRVCP